jgi:predicted metal-binding membrane protein
MTAAPMSHAMGMGMGLTSIPMMAAMMLPSAVPAIARRAQERGGSLGAPMFAGSYLVVWGLAGLVAIVLYRPTSAAVAGVLVVAAGLYELTPLKRECRRRCRAHVRSGTRFGIYCFGSSLGLMVVLIAIDPMSVPLMCGVAAMVLAQKLLPPSRALDVPLALLIVGIGVVVATT